MNAALVQPLPLFQQAIAVSSRVLKSGGNFRPTPEDCDVSAHLLSHPDLDLQVWLEGQCLLAAPPPSRVV